MAGPSLAQTQIEPARFYLLSVKLKSEQKRLSQTSVGEKLSFRAETGAGEIQTPSLLEMTRIRQGMISTSLLQRNSEAVN